MPVDPHFVTRAVTNFPQGGGAILAQSRAGLRGRSAAHAAFRAAEQHLANLTTAAEYDDPEIAKDLKPELQGALLDRLRQRTLGQFQNPLDGYLRTAERAFDEATAAADKHRPKLDPESAAQMIRTDQAWNNHVKPMLTAGKGWDQIIPTLDVDGLLAVQRFAPGYEASSRSRFDQAEVPAALAGIRALSDHRLVDVVTPEARAALKEAQDAAAALDYTRRVAATLEQVSSRDAATASIGLKRATFEAGVQNPVDTSPEARAAYEASLSGSEAA